jgi:hypothetical protein
MLFLATLLIVLGASILFLLLYSPPTVSDINFYLCELFAPVAIFIGLREFLERFFGSDANRQA